MSKTSKKNAKINAYMREKLECECGKIVSRSNMPRHMKSENHKRNVGDMDQLREYRQIIKDRYKIKVRKLEKEKARALKKIDKEIKNISDKENE